MEPQGEEAKTKKVLVVEETPTTEVKPEVAPEVATEVTAPEPAPISIEPVSPPKKKGGAMWFVILAAFLAGALVGGVITFVTGMAKIESATSEVESTPTPASTPLPEKTEAPAEVDRSTLKIQVLNGSGVSGAAATAKTYLEKLGYKSVETGNATASNLAETEISIKVDKENYLDILTSDLKKEYELASESTTLAATSKYDVVITVGKK